MAELGLESLPKGSYPGSEVVLTVVRARSIEREASIEWGIIGTSIEGEAVVTSIEQDSALRITEIVQEEDIDPSYLACRSMTQWLQLYNHPAGESLD